MKTHKILFKHIGENSDTAKKPHQVWENQVDLDEQVRCCLNWDDDRPVKTDKWAVYDVTLPDWLDPVEWIRHDIDWHYAWMFGVDPEWPEAWQRWFAYTNLSEGQKLAGVKLLKTKSFRSGFRRSLREQLETWLDAPAEARKYDTPFSHKQWGCLIDRWTARDARDKGSRIYYGSRYSARRGVPC